MSGFSLGWRKRELPDFLNVPWKISDLVLFVLVWFGVQIGFVVFLGVLSEVVPVVRSFLEAAKNGNDTSVALVLDLVSFLAGFGVLWLFLRKYNTGWSALGWRRVSLWRSVKYVLGLMLVFLACATIVIALVSLLVHGFNANQPQNNEFISGASKHHIAALIGLVVLPPVIEESVFRGFLFPAIAKRLGMVWGAVISSVVFAVAHWQANVSVYTFVLGLVLCFMYVRLRSIVPGIFVHMMNNALALLAILGR